MATKTSSDTDDLTKDRDLMDRFSRQIGAFGTTMMSKLVKMSVLVVGAKGVGAEIAKNLILLGPKKVTLCDPEKVAMRDLGANFCLEATDVGKLSRAEASVRELSQLNPGCDVGVLLDPSSDDKTEAKELTRDLVDPYDVLVICDGSRATIDKWNKYCRNRTKKVPEARGGRANVPDPIGFVCVHARGATGSVFTDFGDSFEIFDDNGEPVTERLVCGITNEKEGVVEVLEAQPRQALRNIQEGFVRLTEVEGCYAKTGKELRELGYQNINEAPLWRVTPMKRTILRDGKQTKVFDPFHVKIGDTRKLSKYVSGGILKEVKVPKTVSFRSFEDALRNPGEKHPSTDMVKFDWATMSGPWHQIHIAYVAVFMFQEANSGRLPVANDEDDVRDVLKRAKAYNEAMRTVNKSLNGSGREHGWYVETLDETLVANYARYAAVELQPMCTFLGGIVAQEVAKWTGKFTPNPGFVHLDFSEIIPDTRPKDVEPTNSRYDHQIAMFGRDFQEKLGDLRTFMVGCGALGCELLKNFAMMGVACGEKGLITVTDDDKIEVSNLNRQFLFRKENVQQYKADAATKRILSYNPKIKVHTEKVKVMPATENVFTPDFWKKQDFITNALDNIKARLYVDGKCVENGLPLLESGTLGTKCNTVIVVPHKTKSYADGNEGGPANNEAAIPMCTLRNFPTLLDHCVEWSRAQFTDLFVEPMKRLRNVAENVDAYLDKVRSHRGAGGDKATARSKDIPMMKDVKRVLEMHRDASFESCVAYAWDLYHRHFRDVIASLLKNCPPGSKDDHGMPFWSAKKKVPHTLDADLTGASAHSKYALQFVLSVANIMCAGLGVVPCPDGATNLLPWDHPMRSEERVRKICASLEVPDVVYSKTKNTKEKEDESEDGGASKDDDDDDDESNAEDALFEDLVKWLEANKDAVRESGTKVTPANWEKDQDRNFHIDFIEAYSNLRALNYNIKPGTRHKTKMIAGKILPAILTATASITGLIMLELYKLVQEKPLSSVRNAFCNLGVNVYSFENPDPIPVTKERVDEMGDTIKVWPAKGFTKWDQVVVDNGDMTVDAFREHVKKLTDGLSVEGIMHPLSVVKDSVGHGQLLWTSACWNPKMKAEQARRKKMKLSHVIREVHGVADDVKEANGLELTLQDEDDVEYAHPRLVYRWA